MIIKEHSPLRTEIDHLIRDHERFYNYTLSDSDRLFLVDTVDKFVEQSIQKFIHGGMEHNPDGDEPFLTSVDHAREMDNEIIDFLFYHAANKHKTNK